MKIEKRYVILEFDSVDEHEYGDRWETILPADTTLNAAKGYAREEAQRISVDRHRVELAYLDCEIEEDRPQYSIGTVLDGDGYNPIDYRPLPLYIYRGKVGVIHLNEFITEEQAEILGLTANDCDLTYDDSYDRYGDNADIIQESVVNIENEQKLMCDVWVSENWFANDYIERMYLVLTDRYYDWTSHITECLDEIQEESKNIEDALSDLEKDRKSTDNIHYSNDEIQDIIKGICYSIDKIRDIIDDYISTAESDIKEHHPDLYRIEDIKKFLCNQEEYQNFEDLKKTFERS